MELPGLPYVTSIDRMNIEFKCFYCDYFSRNKLKFRHHVANHHNRIPYTQCNGCTLLFFSKLELDDHFIQQHLQTHIQYVSHNYFLCRLCAFRTTLYSKMYFHVKDRAILPETFQCLHCNEILFDKFNLIVHFNQHTFTEDHQFECPVKDCSEKFLKKWLLDDHILYTKGSHMDAVKYVTKCRGVFYLDVGNK